ncbi:hypothetical protein GCM10007082_16370 [Oceanisphaera arctica]|nr:hypothetical protein GCM10007082_16370 [Oceanisphaera arctica]
MMAQKGGECNRLADLRLPRHWLQYSLPGRQFRLWFYQAGYVGANQILHGGQSYQLGPYAYQGESYAGYD